MYVAEDRMTILAEEPSAERQRRQISQRRRSTRRSTTPAGPTRASTAEPVIRVGILLVDDRAMLASSLAVVLDLDAGLDVVAMASTPVHANRVLAAGASIVLVD